MFCCCSDESVKAIRDCDAKKDEEDTQKRPNFSFLFFLNQHLLSTTSSGSIEFPFLLKVQKPDMYSVSISTKNEFRTVVCSLNESENYIFKSIVNWLTRTLTRGVTVTLGDVSNKELPWPFYVVCHRRGTEIIGNTNDIMRNEGDTINISHYDYIALVNANSDPIEIINGSIDDLLTSLEKTKYYGFHVDPSGARITRFF